MPGKKKAWYVGWESHGKGSFLKVLINRAKNKGEGDIWEQCFKQRGEKNSANALRQEYTWYIWEMARKIVWQNEDGACDEVRVLTDLGCAEQSMLTH